MKILPLIQDFFAPFKHSHSLRLLALGFSAGLPLLLVLGTLSFWLREAGINRSTIGHMSWIGLAYASKFLWAPLVDRIRLPLLGSLGRRRSWLLLSQTVIALGLAGMAMSDPKAALDRMVFFALLVAFASATQDIALDAMRVELASADQQAALSACYQAGYRIAMIWAGAGVLWIAARAEVATPNNYDAGAWGLAYSVMALTMLLGIVATFLTPEPAATPLAPAKTALEWLQQSIANPFVEFFKRLGWSALLILALIAIYRISDIVMGIMANPFYVDMGFSKTEVAGVTKVYGLLMTILGAFIGGALAPKLGVLRLMMVGAVLSAATNLLFVWLGIVGHNVNALIAVISADNLASGLAGAAFVAYLSGLTNKHYTATQYALFSSLMLLLPKFLAGFSGEFVDAYGYTHFFIGTAALGLPVVVLIAFLAKK